MTNEMASKLNTDKASEGRKRCIMTADGQLIPYYRFDTVDPSKVHQLDAYNATLQTFTLGVDCVMVERKRVQTVTETFTVVEA